MPTTLRDKRDEVIASFVSSLDKVINGYENSAASQERGHLYTEEVVKLQALFEAELTLTFHGSRVRIISKIETLLNEAPPMDSTPPPDTDPVPTQGSGTTP